MRKPLTNAEFAGHAAAIAREASSWTASLCLPDARISENASAAAVTRFTDSIRERLDLLDHWVGCAALAEQEKGDA